MLQMLKFRQRGAGGGSPFPSPWPDERQKTWCRGGHSLLCCLMDLPAALLLLTKWFRQLFVVAVGLGTVSLVQRWRYFIHTNWECVSSKLFFRKR